MPGAPDRHDLAGSELSEEDQPTVLQAVFQTDDRRLFQCFTVLQWYKVV